MAVDWPEVPLTELYDVSSGLSKPSSAFGTGYPFLSFKDIFYNIFIPKNLTQLVQSTEEERLKCSVRRGDVFLTRTSETMNELGMSSVALEDIPDATFNGFTKRLRPKDASRIIPEYAAYFFRSPRFRQAVTAMCTLSTRASLNTEMLSRLSMLVPPLGEQDAIGHVLSTLDNKIDLNRRISETLEAMARALFKSWFVDFDPVRAKAQGRWRKGESLPGLPAHLYDFFPDSFGDSLVGEIPKGWRVGGITDFCEIAGGSTPRTDQPGFWEPKQHAWATPKDLSKLESPILLKTERQVSDAGLAQISSGLLPAGTVLLSSRAPIGYLAIANVPVAINQGFIAMKPRKGVPSSFLLLWAGFAKEEILSRANGSTFLEISKSSFREIPAITFPEQLLLSFSQQTQPLYSRLATIERESEELAALRDSLLPKLVSGELRLAGFRF